jgi:O-acetyl-ADP-ribose deacetylase (regulator of RNase III)
MIEFRNGDIFDSGCEAICNPVNCMGVMSAGLALQFKNRYPEMFTEYKKCCDDGLLTISKLHVWENKKGNPKWIVNFPTKNHWRKASMKAYINSGLFAVAKWIKQNNITSIGIPALGCGYGGLSWGWVKQMLEAFAKRNPDVNVVSYMPK